MMVSLISLSKAQDNVEPCVSVSRVSTRTNKVSKRFSVVRVIDFERRRAELESMKEMIKARKA